MLIRKQSGLTLLEIMITLVILSLGLLGLAGLQMTGLKNNRNAYYQTVAAQIAQDLAERIKADQAGAKGTTYDNISQSGDSSKCKANPSFTERVACQVAALPLGQARVKKRSDTPKSFYVALVWTDTQSTQVGWANADATTACGTATVGVICSYTVVMP